jgi:hypothetical protein
MGTGNPLIGGSLFTGGRWFAMGDSADVSSPGAVLASSPPPIETAARPIGTWMPYKVAFRSCRRRLADSRSSIRSTNQKKGRIAKSFGVQRRKSPSYKDGRTAAPT